jgi:hypothetical protein
MALPETLEVIESRCEFNCAYLLIIQPIRAGDQRSLEAGEDCSQKCGRNSG